MTTPDGFPSWSRKTNITHYGGTLDKINNFTEGDTTVIYIWYRVLQGALGSALDQDFKGLLHAENLATARIGGSLSRAIEKLSANSHPISSDEELYRWLIDLGIDVKIGEDVASQRKKADAKLKLASGPIQYIINNIIFSIIGSIFIQTSRSHTPDLDNPPPKTYWPFINPGPPEYNLYADGTKGPWTSERNHLVVVVQKPSFMSNDEFARLMNGEVKQQLDLILPSYVSWDWVTQDSFTNGFLAGISLLDFDSITYL